MHTILAKWGKTGTSPVTCNSEAFAHWSKMVTPLLALYSYEKNCPNSLFSCFTYLQQWLISETTCKQAINWLISQLIHKTSCDLQVFWFLKKTKLFSASQMWVFSGFLWLLSHQLRLWENGMDLFFFFFFYYCLKFIDQILKSIKSDNWSERHDTNTQSLVTLLRIIEITRVCADPLRLRMSVFPHLQWT